MQSFFTQYLYFLIYLSNVTMQDFLIVLLCMLGYAVAGVLGALGTLSWSRDFVNQIDNISPLNGLIDIFEPTRTLLLATTVSD